MISRAQFEEWKEHPVTIDFYEKIEEIKKQLLENISSGLTIAHRADITHGLTNRMVGHIEGLDQLINATYDDDEEKPNESEQPVY